MPPSDVPAPTAPNASTALARTVVDELVRCGLRDVVVGAGSRSTALTLACHADERVRTHVCIDERSAAFVALGIARATRRAAAVVTTSGSAVANLHPAVVEANHARVPLLLLTADRPPELRDTGANQTVDQVKAFGDDVRWFVELGVPQDVRGANAHWRSTASQAWARAVGDAGVPGPVHANLAFREPTVPASDDGRTSTAPFTGPLDGRADDAPWTRVRRPVQRDDAGARLLAERLRGAERPLLLVGSADLVPAPVTQLARAAEMPMLAEPLSNCRRGRSGLAHGSLLVAAGLLPAPDLVVRVGRPGLSRAVEQWLGPDVPQVLVDAHGGFLDPARAVAEVVVADPEPFCAVAAADLRERPRAAGPDGWLAEAKALDGRVADLLDERFADDVPTGPSVARRLVAELPRDAALVVGSSAPIRDVDAHAPLREDLWMVGNRGASGIDGFTSTALGIALRHAGPTFALCGDLSFLHDQGGWLLRPDPGDPQPDLVLVVVDNDGGGLFHHLPVAEHDGFERLFGTPHGLDLGAIAAAHGVGVHAPTSLDGLAEALAAAHAAGGRQLVHVRTDRAVEAEQRRAIAKDVAALQGVA